jgi:hypothetical protein
MTGCAARAPSRTRPANGPTAIFGGTLACGLAYQTAPLSRTVELMQRARPSHFYISSALPNALRDFRFRRCARLTKRQNSASRAEIVFSRHRSPPVYSHFFERRQEAKRVRRNSECQCAAASSNRTIAFTHMVDVSVHFEANSAAMASSTVGLHSIALILLASSRTESVTRAAFPQTQASLLSISHLRLLGCGLEISAAGRASQPARRHGPCGVD